MKRAVLTEASEDLTQLDDPVLVSACLAGDSSAWETLIKRYQRLIYSIPLKARLSSDDAADIFQSVCLKLFEKLSSLREYQKLSAWLTTTTTRECWRISSRNRRLGSSFGTDDESPFKDIPAAAPLADAEREVLERQQIVRQAVESLPERCRELLTMLFYQKDELNYAEIARRMGMPVPSVGPTRARCLEKLKKLLEGKL